MSECINDTENTQLIFVQVNDGEDLIDAFERIRGDLDKDTYNVIDSKELKDVHGSTGEKIEINDQVLTIEIR